MADAAALAPSSTPSSPRRCAGAVIADRGRASWPPKRSAAPPPHASWPGEPDRGDAELLDVVQSWAMTCAGDLDGALGPLRRVRRRVQAEGGVWLRGFTDLVAGPAARPARGRATRDDAGELGEEAVGLLVDAAGAFAAAGDRRRYRQSLLELGQLTRRPGPAGRGAALAGGLPHRRRPGPCPRPRDVGGDVRPPQPAARGRAADRRAATARAGGPAHRAGQPAQRRAPAGRLRLDEEPLSLAVVDVDHFKEVNDDTSHTHGDAVLRRVADLLREHSRTGDEVYRWAGDEFLVVLPTASEARPWR